MAGGPRARVFHTQQEPPGKSVSAEDLVHIDDAFCVPSVYLHLLFPQYKFIPSQRMRSAVL